MKVKFTDFIEGIISLIISQILIKIFGVAYSLYLTNKNGFGDQGNAIYMSGYQIYALLLTISSVGIPNAISKIISEKKSQKDYINLERVFKISIFLFALIGFVGCVLLFIFSGFISEHILEIPESKFSLMFLAPAIFFVSINSVIKGYFNGKNRIYITAKCQVIEQVFKSILTILFVEIFSKIANNDIQVLAAVANLATTVATFLSLLYMVNKYINIKKKEIDLNFVVYKKERILIIIKKILSISIPITLSAILSSFGKNIDSFTIVRILKEIIGEENAKAKYGILSSKVDTLIALPLSFNIAISTALIPEISKRYAVKDYDGIIQKIRFSLLITLIIAIPCAFGMFVYSKTIFNLLFPNAKEGYNLLSLASISIIFSMLTQTIYGVLQGIGKNNVAVYASILGLILKILCNTILIPISGIYEKGAIIGNIMSSFISFIIVYITMKKNIVSKINLFKLGFKPILSSIVMICSSLYIYKLLILNNINIIICDFVVICFSVFIYILLVFVTKMIKNNDIAKNVDNTVF